MKVNVYCMPIIPAFRRLRQKDADFKASLGFIRTPCLISKLLMAFAFSFSNEQAIESNTNLSPRR